MRPLLGGLSAILFALMSVATPAYAAPADKTDDKKAKAATTQKEASKPEKAGTTEKKAANPKKAPSSTKGKKGVPDDSI